MITREDCSVVGTITKTHGLQGNVIITTDTDLLERYADEPVFILLDGAPVPFFIPEDGLSVRNHKSYIVKFDYVETHAQAERLVGNEVMIEKRLLDEEGSRMESAPHPKQKLFVRLSGEAEVFDILRKREEAQGAE